MASTSRSTTRRYIAIVYGRRMRRSTRSLPLCSGTWKCGAIAGAVVRISSTSSEKYAGSMEDSLSHRSRGTWTSRSSSAARLERGVRSAPQ
jgi:hypothetical protein